MTIDFEQEWVNTSASSITTLSLTVSGATSGNILIGVAAVRSGGDLFTTPTGWTEITQASGGSFGCLICWREASGTSADNFEVEWTDAGLPGLRVTEYSGVDTTSPVEDWAEDTTNMTTASATKACGTATPTTADGIAIAVLGTNRAQNWIPTSIDSSYTIDTAEMVTWGDVTIAHKLYTTTADQSPTWSTTIGDMAYGAVMVFKAADGAATVTPGPLQKLGSQYNPIAAARLNGALQ